jgi:hypothetical protein
LRRLVSAGLGGDGAQFGALAATAPGGFAFCLRRVLVWPAVLATAPGGFKCAHAAQGLG